MNYALIFAGGAGMRINSLSKPKQFLELNGKEIIIHTLEHFETHPEIDRICVVCIEGWINHLYNQIEKYWIKKVSWIVPGGDTGHLSIKNGLRTILADSRSPSEDIVLIHDGVRPMIDAQLISDNIACVKENGSAITVTPVTETVTITSGGKIENIIERQGCKHAKAPQSFRLADIMDAHNKAECDGKHDFIDSATLMHQYGYRLHEVEGPLENIKITTPSDFYMFRAICEAKENSQIFGI